MEAIEVPKDGADPPTTGMDAFGLPRSNPSRWTVGGAPGRKPSDIPDYTASEAPTTSAPTTQWDSLLEFVPENPAGAVTNGAQLDPDRPPPRKPSVSPATERQTPSRVDATGLEDLRARLWKTDLAIERARNNLNAVSASLIELRVTAVQLAERYVALEAASRHTELRNANAIEALEDIEGRLGPLEIVRDLTNRVDAGLASVNRLGEEVSQRAAHLQAQRESVDEALERVSQANALLVAVEARVAALTSSETLQDAEAAADHLGRRAEGIITNLERRTGEVTARLDARVDQFAGQRTRIEEALSQVARATDLAAGVDAHLAMLMGPGQSLAQAEVRIGDLQRHSAETTAELERHAAEIITRLGRHAAATTADLEQRAAETTGDLERRIDGFDKQKQAIVQTLAEAARVTDLVAALDDRVATFIRPDESLSHAQATVEELERRIASAATRIEQLARRNANLERAVATTEAHQSTMTAPAHRAGLAAATPLWLFATGFAALVVSAALAVGVLRDPSAPDETSTTARLREQSAGATMPLPPVPAPPAGPVEASLSGSAGSPSAEGRDGAVSLPPRAVEPASTQQGAVAALSTVSPGHQETLPAGRESGRTGQPSRTGGAGAQPPRTAALVPPVAPATGAKRFVAVLIVDSEPSGAAVFVDQRHVGQTPVQVPDLRAGTHAIRLEQEGYLRWTAAVLVPAGEETRVSARLQPVKGSPTVGR